MEEEYEIQHYGFSVAQLKQESTSKYIIHLNKLITISSISDK